MIAIVAVLVIAVGVIAINPERSAAPETPGDPPPTADAGQPTAVLVTVSVISTETIVSTATEQASAELPLPVPVTVTTTITVVRPVTPTAIEAPSVTYENCGEARAAGVTPLRSGDAGYSTDLDGDEDGVACE